ncbi:MAG: uroporphyrinogen-III synthase [Arsenophonus sp.]|nr:MAG: uroporphyrinogen-III synthase [Arsenophonus sp.]
MSKNAVWYANSALKLIKKKWPHNLFYYGIGNSTTEIFKMLTNLPIQRSQKGENSETLLALSSLQFLKGKKSLLLRGNGGRELIEKTLKLRGSDVDYCECYKRQKIKYDTKLFQIQCQNANIKTIIVTSGEMLNSLFNLITKDNKSWLLSRHLIIVSKRLANMAHQLGWKSTTTAKSAKNYALIQTLL